MAKKFLRLYALDHPSSLKVLDMELVETPRFFVTNTPPSRCMKDLVTTKWDLLEKMQFAFQIIDVVSDAHRLGIAHDYLSLETVYVTNDNKIKLDFTYALCQRGSLSHLPSESFLDLNKDMLNIGRIFLLVID